MSRRRHAALDSDEEYIDDGGGALLDSGDEGAANAALRKRNATAASSSLRRSGKFQSLSGANRAANGRLNARANGSRAKTSAGASEAVEDAAAATGGYAWEASFQRSWDAVKEDEAGSLASAVKGLLQASKRKRTLAPSHAVQRGIIRHLILGIDLSESMLDKDLRPTRHSLTLQYAREFVNEFFDQNPIGQLGIIGTRDGIAERISAMSGNTSEHLAALANRRRLEPRGEPSLQNLLDMARASLSHLPASNSREILVIYGSLTSCDPGSISDTLRSLARDHMRVSMVNLAAELKVCRDACRRTRGRFGVALNEAHFRDLLFEHVAPPEVEAKKPAANKALKRDANGLDLADGLEEQEGVELLQMGFPTRLPTHGVAAASANSSLCACHSRLRRSGGGGGYVCPRCCAKICDVPTDCPVCGLTVVLSTHLARSYHHLFPVPNYAALAWPRLARLQAKGDEHALRPRCAGCATTFPALPASHAQREEERQKRKKQVQQRRDRLLRSRQEQGAQGGTAGDDVDGHDHAEESMEVDETRGARNNGGAAVGRDDILAHDLNDDDSDDFDDADDGQDDSDFGADVAEAGERNGSRRRRRHLRRDGELANGQGHAAANVGMVAESERYRCGRCGRHFCLACDSFVHATLHVCPGCC